MFSTILLVFSVLLVLWGILMYNRFVHMRQRVKEAWADIDVQLKRRFDLIPNLVNVVKGYATHEREVFQKVTEARNAMMVASGSGDVAKTSALEVPMMNALKSLFAVAEAYPELKASGNFVHLQNELSDTENKIQAARRFYNTAVRDFNTAQEVFPSSIIANFFHFKPAEYFSLEDKPEERENVKVEM